MSSVSFKIGKLYIPPILELIANIVVIGLSASLYLLDVGGSRAVGAILLIVMGIITANIICILILKRYFHAFVTRLFLNSLLILPAYATLMGFTYQNDYDSPTADRIRLAIFAWLLVGGVIYFVEAILLIRKNNLAHRRDQAAESQ